MHDPRIRVPTGPGYRIFAQYLRVRAYGQGPISSGKQEQPSGVMCSLVVQYRRKEAGWTSGMVIASAKVEYRLPSLLPGARSFPSDLPNSAESCSMTL